MGIEHASWSMICFLVVALSLIFVFSRTKKKIELRRIPGVDAIDHGLAVAAERGRPVVFSTGITGVGPVLYACLGLLRRVAKGASRFKSKLIVPQNSPEVTAIVESTIYQALDEAGGVDQFDPNSIVFLSEEQFAFASGYVGIVQRENAGACYLFGSFAAEALILAEAGNQIGAFQVAGSVSPEQVPYFICSADYTLIGEELFAAAAYINEDREQRASLAAQDRLKIIVMFVVLLGVILASIKQLPNPYSVPDLPAFLKGEI